MSRSAGLTIIRVIVTPESDAGRNQRSPPPNRCAPEVRILNPECSRFGSHVQAIQAALEEDITTTWVMLVHQRSKLPARAMSSLMKTIRDIECNDQECFAIRICHDKGAFPARRVSSNSERLWNIDTLIDGASESLLMRTSDLQHLDPDFPSLTSLNGCVEMTARRLERPVHEVGLATRRSSRARTLYSNNQRAYRAEISLGADYAARVVRADCVMHSNPPDTQESTGQHQPVFLLCRGGSGSRLLSRLAQLLGMDTGNTNNSGDDLDLVHAVYRSVLCKLRFPAAGRVLAIHSELRKAILRLQAASANPGQRAFKLPELLLLTDDLVEMFPASRFIHMIRDPLATCLRRTHMTARLDNQIGRLTLAAAYDYAGRPRSLMLSDSSVVRMAATTRHQIETTLNALARFDQTKAYEIRLDQIQNDSLSTVKKLSVWLDSSGLFDVRHIAPPRLVAAQIGRELDVARLTPKPEEHHPADVEAATDILAPLRKRLGYLST
ncbi:MAG: sulfotransferase [Lysobacteraceae bacterium]